jgi:hypothetical protein
MTLYSPKRIAFLPPVVDLDYPDALRLPRRAAFLEQIDRIKKERAALPKPSVPAQSDPGTLSDASESGRILSQNFDADTLCRCLEYMGDNSCPVHGSAAAGMEMRTEAQKDLDEWQADWQATNESNRPPQ